MGSAAQGATSPDATREALDAERPARGPSRGDSALLRAQQAANRGEWAAALQAARLATVEEPDQPTPRWLSGLVELNRGDSSAAQRHFEAALFLERRFLPALLGSAQALEASGRLDRARVRYTQVLEAARELPPHTIVAPLDLSAAAVARLAEVALGGRRG